MLFWLGFSVIEFNSIIYDNFIDHWSDYWNWIDFLSIVTNGAFLSLVNICLYREGSISASTVRTFGSIASFFLWIKAFYWLRLFKNTAYFITLISQTIADIKIFAFIEGILLCAFANFFFILNISTLDSGILTSVSPTGTGWRYVREYVDSPIANALI